MPKVSVLSQTGSSVGDIELNEAIFGIEPNEAVLFEALVQQRASLRQGNHKVKTRAEVAGGGRKPWRQKGTGRARQGSIRSPQWRGGGIVFGPTPRSYATNFLRKFVSLALLISTFIESARRGNHRILTDLHSKRQKQKNLFKVLTRSFNR